MQQIPPTSHHRHPAFLQRPPDFAGPGHRIGEEEDSEIRHAGVERRVAEFQVLAAHHRRTHIAGPAVGADLGMHDVDHVGRGIDAADLGGGVALERGGGDGAGAAGVVEDEGASGQCGEDGGDDMGGDGAGGVADAAFVGGGGAAEGQQDVGERGVGHRRDRRCGFPRGRHCGCYWY